MASGKKPRRTFYPFAYGLFTEETASHCWYCLLPSAKLKKCLGCGVAVFCNSECQTLGWKDHKAECTAAKYSPNMPDLEVRLLGRIVLRYKNILKGRDKKDPHFYKDRTSDRSVMEIWSHSEDMKKDEYAMKKFNGIYDQLEKYYDEKHLLPKEVVFELHCRDYINRHAISNVEYTKEIGKGLYLDLCSYDHSCRPNTIYSCSGFVATLRGLTSDMNISDRTTTFYSYIDLNLSLPERLKLLKDTWYFDCLCDRCKDNEDNVLTSVRCPNCPTHIETPLCLFGKWPYKDGTTRVIICPTCSSELQEGFINQSIAIMQGISRLENSNDLSNMPTVERRQFLEQLLLDASKFLSSVNVFRAKIVQNLIPLVPADDHQRLLDLHIGSEDCLRHCFPKNHPALAFHLRNTATFYGHLGNIQKSKSYLEEAVEILTFTMDEDHAMTKETAAFLDEANAALTKKDDNSESQTLKPQTDDSKEKKIETPLKNDTQEEIKCELEKMNSKMAALLSEDTDDMPPLIDQ